MRALEALLMALLDQAPPTARASVMCAFDARAHTLRQPLCRDTAACGVLAAFDAGVAHWRAALTLSDLACEALPPDEHIPAESVLLTATRISTYQGQQFRSSASGFFFRRQERLYLVTNRHVLTDRWSQHFPDRIDIELHTDAQDLTRCVSFDIPLYRDGQALWLEATDSAGVVDVVTIEIEMDHLPRDVVLQAFDESNLAPRNEDVVVGDALTVIGFPLGFHDTVHHLAVARSASLASAYGVRFQQQGYFLTDARTHRGSSGAPVLRRRKGPLQGASPQSWQLLGVHSARLDMKPRDTDEDESLGLNCVWYADVLMALTNRRPPAAKT
ncbi:MAG: hypothetical protein RI907_3668 [Pseudomonadota bacterium]|jgi:hypothetical protein